MVSDIARACALSGVLGLTACLPDNPPGTTATASDTTAATDTDPTAGTTGVGAAGMLGCPAGQTCPLVIVSESLDDRIEIFAPLHAPVYRGAISLDLKAGSSPTDGSLDEPFGVALAGGFLHVIAGHYPMRESGSMVSFPTSFLAGYDAGATVPVTDFFTGAFVPEVTSTVFAEEEPIFLLEDDVQGRLLIGTFNNSLFDNDNDWTGVGKLVVADAGNPNSFAAVDLSGLQGGDCLGASEVVLVGGTQAAVACDVNEAIAFLNLGMIGTGEPAAAAAAISGSLCEIPGPRSNRRVRYIAPDGVGGVLITYGPTPLDPLTDGLVYQMSPDCAVSLPVTVGAAGAANLGEIVPYSPTSWLVASGGQVSDAQRGIYVISASGGTALELCGPVGGFEDHWLNEGAAAADPYGLAVTSDGQHLAVGAAPFNGVDDALFGKVLWGTLSGTEDPCTMSAEVVDLSDGGADHAPASSPGDPNTWRRGPNVVVIEEVSG